MRGDVNDAAGRAKLAQRRRCRGLADPQKRIRQHARNRLDFFEDGGRALVRDAENERRS